MIPIYLIDNHFGWLRFLTHGLELRIWFNLSQNL
jgi:hypothetical protein